MLKVTVRTKRATRLQKCFADIKFKASLLHNYNISSKNHFWGLSKEILE